ncbi:MAG: DUF1795 domain-containing protein [Chromatiaceae bacterium]|nr:DUF1795 domain-containing protein [Chromatiaceae bacterium]
MPQFQGSGFSLALPDGCYDASAYAFALPEHNGFSPSLVIRFEAVEAGADIQQYADQQLTTFSEQFEGFKLINRLAGKRGQWPAVMATLAWGEGPARMAQKIVYMLVAGEKSRIYTLTTTDLAANAALSDPMFDQILRSFVPNEVQVL